MPVARKRSLTKKRRTQLKKQLDGLFADEVNHPSHYTSHPSGVECVQITEHFNFNIGNSVKYLWRAGLKHPDPKKDLEKALWYIKRELERLSKVSR